MNPDDPLWDDEFHGSAWQAFAEGVAGIGGIPDSGATKRRAYQIYEQGLAAKNDEAGLSGSAAPQRDPRA